MMFPAAVFAATAVAETVMAAMLAHHAVVKGLFLLGRQRRVESAQRGQMAFLGRDVLLAHLDHLRHAVRRRHGHPRLHVRTWTGRHDRLDGRLVGVPCRFLASRQFQLIVHAGLLHGEELAHFFLHAGRIRFMLAVLLMLTWLLIAVLWL